MSLFVYVLMPYFADPCNPGSLVGPILAPAVFTTMKQCGEERIKLLAQREKLANGVTYTAVIDADCLPQPVNDTDWSKTADEMRHGK